jgi:transposase-like protein
VQENVQEAYRQWRQNSGTLKAKFKKLSELMDEAEDDVLAFMVYPREHWAQLEPTNPLERLIKEIKRRALVVGIFPNNGSIIRLVGSLVVEQTDEWQVTRRDISAESLAKVAGTEESPALITSTEVAYAAMPETRSYTT